MNLRAICTLGIGFGTISISNLGFYSIDTYIDYVSLFKRITPISITTLLYRGSIINEANNCHFIVRGI